ncbi:hypothetical protein O3X23_00735 [Streptomyces sp. H39-S7]|nr:hypothetical protein [Streptomyces sp. H39-S7]MCZ4117928.1 hypothetical protein [Streptomyces sp. H39-S7]
MLVITGSPGVGKSSVLGRIVTTADAGIAASLPADDIAIRAPIGAIACAVHAKSKTAMDVATELAQAASAPIPETLEDFLPAIRAALTSRLGDSAEQPPPFRVVVDALDEAASTAQARAIATRIVLPLAETCADLGVQVLVGSRRRDDAGDLLAVFGPAALLVDLDTPEYFAESDLAAYALATLQLAGDPRVGNPYAEERIARPVADRIGALADRNFLVAGLVARTHGMHDTTAVLPSEVSFTPTVEAALRTYLAVLPPVGEVPAAEALTALAYAQAPGFSVGIWYTALKALDGGNLTERQLQLFARSSAANFLIETSLSDTAASYRLFHQALNDVLTGGDHGSRRDEERVLTNAFLAEGRSVGWSQAPHYLLRSLAIHASRGGVIDELLTDSSYVIHADLRPLIPLAEQATKPAARQQARLLRKTPRAITAPPLTRVALFSVTEAQQNLGRRYTSISQSAPYRAVWASSMPSSERAVLDGHTSAVTAVCRIQSDNGDLLVSASDDETIWVWDPATGEEIRIIRGDEGPVRHLCTLDRDGKSFIASAGHGKSINIWNPNTGELVSKLDGGSTVTSLCAINTGSRTLLVSGGIDRVAKVWDPATGRLEHVLRGHRSAIRKLCPIHVRGRTLLATATCSSSDSTVQIWDLETGKKVDNILGLQGPIRDLCAVSIGDQSFLVSAVEDKGVTIWNPTSKKKISLRAHAGAVHSLAAARLADKNYLVTVSSDLGVMMWDPSTGTRRSYIAGRAQNPVAVWESQGRSLLATSSHIDRDVRVWNLGSSSLVATMSGHIGEIRSLCDVQVLQRRLLASTSSDRTVRIWDPFDQSGTQGRFSRIGAAKQLCIVDSSDDSVFIDSSSYDGHEIARRYVGSGEVSSRLRLPSSRTYSNISAAGKVRIGGRDGLVVAFESGMIQVHKLDSGEMIRELDGYLMSTQSICDPMHPTRSLVAVLSQSGTVRIWDLESGAIIPWRGEPGSVSAVCGVTVRSRRLIATGGKDRRVLLWDPTNGRGVERLWGLPGGVNALCEVRLHGADLLVGAGDDQGVQIWNPSTGAAMDTLWGHTGPVRALSVVEYAGRTVIASAGDDRTIRVWDPVDLKCLLQIPNYRSVVSMTSIGGILLVGLDAGVLVLNMGDYF